VRGKVRVHMGQRNKMTVGGRIMHSAQCTLTGEAFGMGRILGSNLPTYLPT
jgi:hypothetical protein